MMIGEVKKGVIMMTMPMKRMSKKMITIQKIGLSVTKKGALLKKTVCL